MQTQELCGNGFVCTNNDTHMIIDWTNQARNNNTVFHRIHVHIYVYNKTTDHWDAINQEDAMKTQVSFRYTWFRDDNFTFGVLRWTSPTTGSTCFSFISKYILVCVYLVKCIARKCNDMTFYCLSALVGCWSSDYIRRINYKFLNVCPLDYTALAVSVKVGIP